MLIRPLLSLLLYLPEVATETNTEGVVLVVDVTSFVELEPLVVASVVVPLVVT